MRLDSLVKVVVTGLLLTLLGYHFYSMSVSEQVSFKIIDTYYEVEDGETVYYIETETETFKLQMDTFVWGKDNKRAFSKLKKGTCYSAVAKGIDDFLGVRYIYGKLNESKECI